MPDLIYRDARPEDIATMLILSHAGDARGPDTPPLDPATLTDPRYRAAFNALEWDDRGNLWVRRVGEEDAQTVDWDVFDPELKKQYDAIELEA